MDSIKGSINGVLGLLTVAFGLAAFIILGMDAWAWLRTGEWLSTNVFALYHWWKGVKPVGGLYVVVQPVWLMVMPLSFVCIVGAAICQGVTKILGD